MLLASLSLPACFSPPSGLQGIEAVSSLSPILQFYSKERQELTALAETTVVW